MEPSTQGNQLILFWLTFDSSENPDGIDCGLFLFWNFFILSIKIISGSQLNPWTVAELIYGQKGNEHVFTFVFFFYFNIFLIFSFTIV